MVLSSMSFLLFSLFNGFGIKESHVNMSCVYKVSLFLIFISCVLVTGEDI